MISSIRPRMAKPLSIYKPRTWNRTAAEVGAAPDQSFASAYWNYSNLENWTSPPGTYNALITLPWQGYGTWPIYRSSTATTQAGVYILDYPDGYDIGVVPEGTLIPWSDAWIPAQDNDGGLLVDDDDYGELGTGWELWSCLGRNPFGLFLGPFFRGWTPGEDVLTGTVARRTKVNPGTYLGRGSGMIPKRSMILTAEEIQAALAPGGDDMVHHALSVVGVNMQAGPYAVANNLYSAPGTKIEHPVTQPAAALPISPDARLVNEGTRFHLDITNGEIDAWLTSRSYTGALRDTARVIAKTLATYGWILTETGTGEPQVECNSIGPGYPSSAAWNSLGVTSSTIARFLLRDLPTADNIVVCNPEPIRP